MSKSISQLSEKVFVTAIDITLGYLAFLFAYSTPHSANHRMWQAQKDVEELQQYLNYKSIKNAINNARKKGLIKKSKKELSGHPEITKAGCARLRRTLPFYEEKRMWDKHLYLITYDIEEKRKYQREMLRNYLKTLGCSMLQESVWLTPYNPKDIIRKYIKTHGIHGMVIVSDIGKSGSIGDETVEDLIVRIYKLKKINKKYQDFINEFDKTKLISFLQITKYMSILKEDPQLPFELLPKWWAGDKAYKIVKPVLKTMVNFTSYSK